MNDRINLLSPELRANPYPFYAELRRSAPVTQVDPGGLWAVSRYDDVLFVLKNPQLFSSQGLRMSAAPPWLGRHNPLVDSMLFQDPPQHGRLRALVSRAFTTSMITRLEEPIRAFTEQLVDRLLERRAVDFVDDFALPLPAYIIGLLLGVDSSRMLDFKRWADVIVSVSATRPEDTELLAEKRRGLEEMEQYLEEVLESHRRDPSDDMVSDLLRVQVDGEALTQPELLGFLSLLLPAGTETTMNLLGQSARMLIERPEVMARLRADPSRIPRFIEEVLRYEPPAQLTMRACIDDVEIAGVTLPRGSLIAVLQGSACRDERQFPDGDSFDPDRPGPHNLPFGHGVHFCLGAPLARMEARIALEALLARVGRLTPGSEPPEWVVSMSIRGLRKLPVELHPA